MSERRIKIGSKEYRKVNLIYNADTGAGFTALIIFALNGVRKAIEHNDLPVVLFDKKTTFHFYDPAHGDNVWEYFFFPVAAISSGQLKKKIADGILSQQEVFKYTEKEIRYLHLKDSERLATFWANEEPENREEWMSAKRTLGRSFVKQYIKVKPHILQKVNTFVQQNFQSGHIIGVHIRGTDFSYAEPTRIGTYFEGIDKFLEKNKIKEFQIFLATDQTQFVELFMKKYEGKVIVYDAIRSSSDISPFCFNNVSNYKKGEDVLIDILLLSKCDYLFKGAAAVGEMALWFNEGLNCTDFGLKSHYDKSEYTWQQSAYLKLNIDHKGSLYLFVRRSYLSIIKFFYSTSVFKKLLEQFRYIKIKFRN